jgi:hypothetical protein
MAGVGVSNLEQLMAIEWKFVAAREAEQSLFVSRLFPAKKKPFMDARPGPKKNYKCAPGPKKTIYGCAPRSKKKIINARPVQKKPFMDARPGPKKEFSCTRIK